MTVTLDGLHPVVMRPRVEALLADPDAVALGMYVVSAFRPLDEQARLYADECAKVRAAHPSWSTSAVALEAGKWVAPAGRSNHGPTLDDAGNHVADQATQGRWGSAVDLGIPGTVAVSGQWPAALEAKVNDIAARYGLASPMDWEDWHFEPVPGWTAPASPAVEEDDDMLNITPPIEVEIDRATGRGYAVVTGVKVNDVRGFVPRVESAGSMKGVVPEFGLDWTGAPDGDAVVWAQLPTPPLMNVKVHVQITHV